MDEKLFKKLIEQAKKDPKFFHALVFEPEKILSSLELLGRQERGNILSANIDKLFAHLIGARYCGVTCTSSCGATCGPASCSYTTNHHPEELVPGGMTYFSSARAALEGCGVTCTSSCGATCKQSCGYTTNRTLEEASHTYGFSSFEREQEGCGMTCASSCGKTRNRSCGYTTQHSGSDESF